MEYKNIEVKVVYMILQKYFCFENIKTFQKIPNITNKKECISRQ